MRLQIIDMLRNAPANSVDFKNTLNEATNLEIVSAVTLMYGKPGCKGKTSACDKELRSRGKGAESNEKT